MLATDKPLKSLTAEDLMSRDLLVVSQHTPLRAAAEMLSRAGVNGAPVIDESGTCVGVLSASDFIRWAREEQPSEKTVCLGMCICADWQVVEMEEVPCQEVRTFMTTNPVLAAPDTSISTLARLMLEAHLHRVIVVDARQRPIGLVSASDVMAAVARACD